MSIRLSPSQVKYIRFCEEYPEAKRMLDRVAHANSSKVLYSIGVKSLCDFLNKNPSEIVDEYTKDIQKSNYDAFNKWEQIFADFLIHLRALKNPKTLKTLQSSSIAVRYAGAKSLINNNVPRSQRLQTETPEVHNRIIPSVTIEDLIEVYSMCTVQHRAFISVLKDSGASADDALRLTIKDLKGFMLGREWVHIEMIREKEHVQYETFLGPNAVRDLRAYLKIQERKGLKITDETPVFTSAQHPFERLHYHSLHEIFYRIYLNTNIRISTHRLRKFFETYMALVVRHPIVLKYWMGHKIRKSRDVEARYIIPPTPEQLKLYREAYRNINVSNSILEKNISVIENERPQLIKKHQVITVQRNNHAAQMNNASQKVVTEDELQNCLSEGWRFVTVLPSGNIVIENAQNIFH